MYINYTGNARNGTDTVPESLDVATLRIVGILPPLEAKKDEKGSSEGFKSFEGSIVLRNQIENL